MSDKEILDWLDTVPFTAYRERQLKDDGTLGKRRGCEGGRDTTRALVDTRPLCGKKRGRGFSS